MINSIQNTIHKTVDLKITKEKKIGPFPTTIWEKIFEFTRPVDLLSLRAVTKTFKLLILLSTPSKLLPGNLQEKLKNFEMHNDGVSIYHQKNQLILHFIGSDTSQSLNLDSKLEPLSLSFVDKCTILVKNASKGLQFVTIKNGTLCNTKFIEFKKGSGHPIYSNKTSEGIFVGTRCSSPSELIVFKSDGIMKTIQIKSSEGKDLRTLLPFHCGGIAINKDCAFCLFSLNDKNYVQSYSLKEGKLIHTAHFELNPTHIFTIADVLLICFEEEIIGYNNANLEQKFTYKTEEIKICKIYNNQLFLLLENGKIIIVESSTGKTLGEFDPFWKKDKVNDFAISQNCLALSSTKHRMIEIWDHVNNLLITKVNIKEIPHAIAFDSNYLSVEFEKSPYVQYWFYPKKTTQEVHQTSQIKKPFKVFSLINLK